MRIALGAVAAAMLFLAACSDSDDTADALSKVCESQAEVLTNLENLAALDPASNTSEEFKDAAEDLRGSVENLVDARGELKDQDVDNVENAYNDLIDELKDLDDVPLSEASAASATAVEAQIDSLNEMYAAAYASSSCSE